MVTGIAFVLWLFGGIRGHHALRGNKFGVWFLSLLALAGTAIYFAAAR